MVASSSKTKKTKLNIADYIAIALFALILLWFAVVSPVLTRLEKNRFEAAKSNMKQLVDTVKDNMEANSSEETTDNCGRPNMKFSEGPLSCNVGYVLKVRPISVDKANEILTAVSRFGSGQLREGPLTSNTSFVVSKKRSSQVIFQDLPDSQRLSCGLSYSYVPAGYRSNTVDELHIRASCGGPARAEHYPVVE